MLTTRDGPAVINAKGRYWSKIVIFAPVKELDPRRNIARRFGMEKLEWCGYPTVKKKIVITRFDTIHKRDRQQDGRADGWTLHDGIGRAYA